MVQWLKHSSETREVVSSSLNSDLFFFFFFFISLSLLHVLMDRKVSFICYKMILVCFYLQLYILLFCGFFVLFYTCTYLAISSQH